MIKSLSGKIIAKLKAKRDWIEVQTGLTKAKGEIS
jgi:hypothetical protein